MLLFAMIALFGAATLIAWLVLNLAIYALPALIAVFTAQALHRAGRVWLLAIPGGLFAGVMTSAIGQISLPLVTSTWARLMIIAAFVTPAAIAGFYATHGLVGMVSHMPLTCQEIGVLGAIVVGATAFLRLITPPPALAGASQPTLAG